MPTTKQTLEKILAEVRGMKEKSYMETYPAEWYDCCGEGENTGYNKAFEMVESLLLAEIEKHE